MLPLTKRQREIFDYLNEFIQQHGYAPSLEEIGKRFGLSSLATVHKHLTNLQEKGFIRRAWNRSRSVEMVPARTGVRALELNECSIDIHAFVPHQIRQHRRGGPGDSFATMYVHYTAARDQGVEARKHNGQSGNDRIGVVITDPNVREYDVWRAGGTHTFHRRVRQIDPRFLERQHGGDARAAQAREIGRKYGGPKVEVGTELAHA